MRSSMVVSSHDSKSGVTGSPIHSPKRSMRVYAPGAGGSHETSGGSAVIGLAWRIHSVPSAPIAHSMSCGVPRALAMRRASSRDLQCLAAIDGVLRLAARGGAIAPDDPFVADGLAGHEPLPEATHCRDDAGMPIPVDRIGRERHAGRERRDHALDDHRHAAVAGGLVRGDARRAGAGKASIRRRRQVVRGDIEHRLVHAGEGLIRAILRDAARPDRERTRSQVPRARGHQPTAFGGFHGGGRGRHHDAIRHANPRREQLAEAGRLAADIGGIGHADVAQPSNRGRRTHRLRPLWAASMAARTIQSTSSAASSTVEPRWSRHVRSADEDVRMTMSRVIRS